MWLYRMHPYYSFRYLKRRLIWDVIDQHDSPDSLRHKFVDNYLQSDGIFMIRLIANNVSDYVCRKIIFELFQIFHRSYVAKTIGREPLFQSLSSLKTDDESDEIPSEKIETPPIPNPRQGKISVERISLPKLPIENENETNEDQQSSISNVSNVEQTRLRTSAIPMLKDLRRTPEIHSDSPERQTPRYKNLDFQLEPEKIVSTSTSTSTSTSSSSPLEPISSGTKGPSPYATTYLTTKKAAEHELPYIDDSMSSGSTSARVRQMEKMPLSSIPSTNVFFRRSHDV